jgi:hypothetical protein
VNIDVCRDFELLEVEVSLIFLGVPAVMEVTTVSDLHTPKYLIM